MYISFVYNSLRLVHGEVPVAQVAIQRTRLGHVLGGDFRHLLEALTQRLHFDFAPFDKTIPFFDAHNNRVNHTFNEEATRKPASVFDGLRVKMYSVVWKYRASA